jgi:transcription initiation factor TFIIIB Brf1 subunit/transcription initiation factor TFIIB
MVHTFGLALDHRLAKAPISLEVRLALKAQHTKLAAISVPENLDEATRQIARRAIDQSFVRGFKLVMLIGAALAVAGAIAALALIRNPDIGDPYGK